MGAKNRSAREVAGMSHRHHATTVLGDGSTVEFALPQTVLRDGDLVVYVAGAHQVLDAQGTAHDYALRGITAGWPGDSNRVKFHTAPGSGAKVTFIIAGG